MSKHKKQIPRLREQKPFASLGMTRLIESGASATQEPPSLRRGELRRPKERYLDSLKTAIRRELLRLAPLAQDSDPGRIVGLGMTPPCG
jgi:hypothetical protein